MEGIGSMRFPVFLLGLLISSLCVGVVFWVAGASIGKSLGWALGAFFIGQVLYVALVAILARGEGKSSQDRTTERKSPDPADVIGRAPLAARPDQQG
jgi:membrane protein DedA with SNARE-associated domain